MSNARVHTRNLIANWAGQATNLLVMFFLSPFVMHTLGKSEFGLWTLLTVVTGYMGLFDLGVRASTGRYIILYYGRQDHERLGQTLRTGLGFFSLAGGLIFLGAIGVGQYFEVFFPKAPAEYGKLAAVLLPILAVNIWLSILGGLFTSVLAAHDRFDLVQVVNLCTLTVRVVGTILVLNAGYGVKGLTVVVLAEGMIGSIGNYSLARHIYPRLRGWPLLLMRARLREMFSYGIPAFLLTAAGRVINQSAVLLVGAFVGVLAVSQYWVGAMLPFYFAPFLMQIGYTLFPAIQRAVARQDWETTRWLLLRQVRVTLLLELLVFIGFLTFGGVFIRIWMGPEFGDSYGVLAILSVSAMLTSLSYGGVQTLKAMGRQWFQVAVLIVEGIACVAFAMLFGYVLGGGIAGFAIGVLVGRSCDFIILWWAGRAIQLRWSSLLDILLRGLATAVGFGCWCLFIRANVTQETWTLFFVQVALATIGYLPLAFMLLVSKADRARVYPLFRKLLPWPGKTSVRQSHDDAAEMTVPAGAVVADNGKEADFNGV